MKVRLSGISKAATLAFELLRALAIPLLLALRSERSELEATSRAFELERSQIGTICLYEHAILHSPGLGSLCHMAVLNCDSNYLKPQNLSPHVHTPDALKCFKVGVLNEACSFGSYVLAHLAHRIPFTLMACQLGLASEKLQINVRIRSFQKKKWCPKYFEFWGSFHCHDSFLSTLCSSLRGVNNKISAPDISRANHAFSFQTGTSAAKLWASGSASH